MDHLLLLASVEVLKHLSNAMSLGGNIYTKVYVTFIGSQFGQTQPVPLARGTIQGDTLSPYAFLEQN